MVKQKEEVKHCPFLSEKFFKDGTEDAFTAFYPSLLSLLYISGGCRGLSQLFRRRQMSQFFIGAPSTSHQFPEVFNLGRLVFYNWFQI